MTVVVAVKVFDGMVVAADSATTVPLAPPACSPFGPSQVYNNADKIFHLHRNLPIGLATWGGGYIGTGSISTLAKDLRRRLMGLDELFPKWSLDESTYTVRGVVDDVVRFFYDEKFANTGQEQPATGLLIVGYSARRSQGEAWELILNRQERPEPHRVFGEDTSGWRVSGLPMAVSRLIEGIGPGLKKDVMTLMPEEKRPALQQLFDAMGGPVVIPAMPLADAIDFARFCADVTVGYVRFTPGADIVGGPIDIAAISRHEIFKWIQRKHFYDVSLNPRRPHDHDQPVGGRIRDDQRSSESTTGEDRPDVK